MTENKERERKGGGMTAAKQARQDSPQRPTSVYLAFSVAIVVVLATWFGQSYHGHGVKPQNAAPHEVSAERALATLTDLLGDQQPHPVGSPQNDTVRRKLVQHLRGLNYNVTEYCYAGRVFSVTNVLATLPGNEKLRPILLATHYDSHPAGPGAGDAGACVAALLETARALTVFRETRKDGDWPTVFFLFTDGEEAGLVGAELFVQNEPTISDKNPMVLNFDARGAAGPSLMYETSRNNLKLMQQMLSALPRPAFTASSYVSVYDMLPNGTDFTEFKTAGLDGLNFAFIDDPHRYHTPEDTLQNLDARSVQHHANNAFLLLQRWLEAPADDLKSQQNAVFFDVGGQFIVCYPESFAVWFAGIVMALHLAGWLRTIKSEGSARATFDTCAALLVGTIGSAAAGWIMSNTLQWGPRSSHGFGIYDSYLIAILWVAAFTSMWLAFRFLGGTASTESTWTVVWILSAILGLASAISVPGFSYIFLTTGLVPGILGAYGTDRRLASVFSVTVAAVFLVPMGSQFGIALGLRSSLILSILYTMFLAPLYPLLTKQPVANPSGLSSATESA